MQEPVEEFGPKVQPEEGLLQVNHNIITGSGEITRRLAQFAHSIKIAIPVIGV